MSSAAGLPRSKEQRPGKRTLEDEEIVFGAFAERDELNDARVVGTAHDLDLFEDVCALK
jgi:hypothetical protein